ncbi:hypothetical protein [Sphingopyxis indica]|uniref:hypothetical protein n=1 Tax=Sphingopyxis indica TaxID=436663 RepID=UPI001BAFBE14|nr:hypothetical protein [Sphingopyxis indica]
MARSLGMAISHAQKQHIFADQSRYICRLINIFVVSQFLENTQENLSIAFPFATPSPTFPHRFPHAMTRRINICFIISQFI